MDQIQLLGMQFYGYHGVFLEEQTLGQRFTVDVTLSLSLQQAGQTDELEFTVNYADVYACVKRIVEGTPKKLIESVAETIANELIEQFPIHAAEIRVVKEQPPIPGVIGHVAVQIKRFREGGKE
jgi:dihydroneopterin aldolase